MMSEHGKTFFFACHLLYAALQIYDEVQEAIGTHHVGQRFSKWTTPYEQIAGFLIEGFMVPMEDEAIDKDENLAMQMWGEWQGDLIFEQINDKLKTFVYNITVRNSDMVKEEAIYFFYCRLLLRILEEFQSILREQATSMSSYYVYYQNSLSRFNNLITPLSREALGNINIQSEIDAVAVQIANDWKEAVYSASSSFKYPTLMPPSSSDAG